MQWRQTPFGHTSTSGNSSRSRRTLLGGLLALPAYALVPRLAPGQGASLPKLEDLLSVAEFEAAARAVLPPAYFGYLATGIDDDRTVAWNHEAYGQLEISVARFADVSRFDMGVTLFGARWPSPVYLSAVGSQRAFHPEAEPTTARAAGSRSALLMRSAAGSTGPEDVMAARGGVPVLVDGGVRRGTDVFKALALGASAVGIGRPQIWGLAPYGQAGVEAVLDIYARELRAIMRQAGTPNVAAITRYSVVKRK